MRRSYLYAFVALFFALPLQAGVGLPSLFSDGMILQQETAAPIWGTADPNQEVTVSFQGQELSTSADENGAWRVEFKNLKASKESATLTIQASGETTDIQNVLVGEVWLASGQSNMAWTLGRSTTAEYAKNADNPYVIINRRGKWGAAKGDISEWSGVAFHFAESLQKELDIPVGFITFASGATPIEAFISEQALLDLPGAEFFIEKKKYALAKYQKDLRAWEDGGKKGKAPKDPNKLKFFHSTVIRGITENQTLKYGARGVIWYQGESNAYPTVNEKDPTSRARSVPHFYGELLECMVNDWRRIAGKELSFYYVQLSNFREQKDAARNEGWMMVIDEMRRALDTIPNSGMAVTNETSSDANLHSANKITVGERLALIALAKNYGKDVLYSGPLYKSAEFQGDNVIVSFDYANGLKSKDGKPLQWFEVAGEDGNWTKAEAVIQGEQVIVSAVSVKEPTKVRYAWSPNPLGVNFVNEAGLPASCFSSGNK